MEASGRQLSLLQDIAMTLDACIDEVSIAELHETAALLSIARLDLMARIHRVTEQELDQLERAIGRRKRIVTRIQPSRLHRGVQERSHSRQPIV